LGGGPSAEREISIISAQGVYSALQSTGDASLEIMDERLPQALDPRRDILFLTTHGSFGEDGQLQSLLEKQGFAYTGCDSRSSAKCFDKEETKEIARRSGVSVAEGIYFTSPPPADKIWTLLGPKLILKPNAQGSSVGLFVIDNKSDLVKALGQIGGQPYLAETYIEGRELTVGLLNNKPLAIVEIIPNGGVYDYKHKYTAEAAVHECPARISSEVTKRLQEYALAIYNNADCRDFARADFRLAEDGTPYFLEINTLPGMTPLSLLPESAAACGYSYSSLVQEMLRGARARYAQRYVLTHT